MDIMDKKKLLKLGTALYLLASVLSFGALKVLGLGPTTDQIISPTVITPAGSKFKIDPSIPRDQTCPLNGDKFTKMEKDTWATRRPLAVMIENHMDSRPQSGLSHSDVVYEAVAEGGITRFLALFYCQAAAEDVELGPIRSARTYFIDFASEYGDKPLYVHVGGANSPGPANALGQLDDYDWVGVNDINQFSVGFPTFWRDYDRLGHEVATEHTMYSTTEKLWAYVGKNRELTNVDKKGVAWDTKFIPYEFKDDAKVETRPETASLGFIFWKGYSDYAVQWNYDKKTNSYLRLNANQPHMDKDNNTQLSAKNVVVLFMAEQNANDGYENNVHLLYKDKGTGSAKVYQDGKKISATWQKKDRISRLKLIDSNTGGEVKLNRGRIWFEVLPSGTKVNES
ncbi:DUF3048 domain-containing protein [Candidatus Gottesmanbacteria bacterium]|nr:DUF3048 domain-containing protein [Candidatus Gottesmanbacteria bacterium]